MIYLYPIGDTFTIFYVKPNLTGLIEIDELPTGNGILKRKADGTFYYDPFPEVVDPPTEPEPPVEPEQPKPELSVEEMQAQTLLNIEYLVSRSELGLGGN